MQAWNGEERRKSLRNRGARAERRAVARHDEEKITVDYEAVIIKQPWYIRLWRKITGR